MRNLTAQQLMDARKKAEKTVRAAVEQAMSEYAMETGQQVIQVDVSILRYSVPDRGYGKVASIQVYDVRLNSVDVSTTAGEQV